MYPNEIILGMDLYSILITVGVIACMVLIRVLSDKKGFSARWQNFLLFTTVVSVILGYGCAVLVQGLYNIARDGRFVITNSTGATFLGGLLGGAAVFLAIYFWLGGYMFRDGYHKAHLEDLLSLGACCIPLAHGFGRLGCLMAGCCYGAETNAWYGINMYNTHHEVIRRVIPVQLYEAVFLFILAAVLVVRYVKGKRHSMVGYMLAYGIWRFLIEYLRGDYRGQTIVRFLTPSQLISMVLILGCVGVYALEDRAHRKYAVTANAEGTSEASGEEEEIQDANETQETHDDGTDAD